VKRVCWLMHCQRTGNFSTNNMKLPTGTDPLRFREKECCCGGEYSKAEGDGTFKLQRPARSGACSIC
jgi:hypothetical protein